MENTALTPLHEAVRIAGGQSALARLIDARQQDIWYWLNRRGGVVSPEFAPRIEAATGVSRKRLCPKVFGTDPDYRNPNRRSTDRPKADGEDAA